MVIHGTDDVMILEQAEKVERLRVEATDYGGLLLHGSGHTNSCGAVKQVCWGFKSSHKFPGMRVRVNVSNLLS